MYNMRRAFSDTFTFGRSGDVRKPSKVEKRLSECLPAADWPVYDECGELKAFNGWHVFGSETARDHFIKHVLILLSDNGKNDLGGLHFDNFFARSYDMTGVIWFTASIVATVPGDFRIRHSVLASRAGMTKTAAFQLLMLEVETKLDSVLRGKGLNTSGLPTKHVKPKKSLSAVSIISTPSEAMAPPKPTDDHNTWSGGPLSSSPKKAKSSMHSSHASKSSHGTQKSVAFSKYSQDSQSSQSSQSTAPSTNEWSVSSKFSVQPPQSAPNSTQTSPNMKTLQRARHASTPLLQLQPASTGLVRTANVVKHASQPLHPRSASTPPTTQIKILPPAPKPSMEKIPLMSEPEQIHPAFRSESPNGEGLKPVAQSKEPSISGSSVYSRPEVSPLDDEEAKTRALHVDTDLEDTPSPLHFEKPCAKLPARFLRRASTEFEIYV